MEEKNFGFVSITNCHLLITDIIKYLIGCLRFVLAGKNVMTDGIVLHFSALLIVGAQKIQASLKDAE